MVGGYVINVCWIELNEFLFYCLFFRFENKEFFIVVFGGIRRVFGV